MQTAYSAGAQPAPTCPHVPRRQEAGPSAGDTHSARSRMLPEPVDQRYQDRVSKQSDVSYYKVSSRLGGWNVE